MKTVYKVGILLMCLAMISAMILPAILGVFS